VASWLTGCYSAKFITVVKEILVFPLDLAQLTLFTTLAEQTTDKVVVPTLNEKETFRCSTDSLAKTGADASL
jgi:hypothetical protein